MRPEDTLFAANVRCCCVCIRLSDRLVCAPHRRVGDGCSERSVGTLWLLEWIHLYAQERSTRYGQTPLRRLVLMYLLLGIEEREFKEATIMKRLLTGFMPFSRCVYIPLIEV